MRSVQMQRTHKVYNVGTELCVFQKRRESSLDKFDTLFGCVYLRGLCCIERDEAVPDVAFVFFEPSFHFIHLLLRQHTFVVEYARVLLQVFKRRAFARSLAFRRYVIEYVFLASHIKERSLIRVAFTLLVRRCFRQTIWRILNIENDRLAADFLYLLSFLIPSASKLTRYSGVSARSPVLNSLMMSRSSEHFSQMKLKIDERMDLLIVAFSTVSRKS